VEKNDNGTYKAHLRPPHIPRKIPAIYQVLEGIEEKIGVIERVIYKFRRSNKGQGE
jgi:hypothetical protein